MALLTLDKQKRTLHKVVNEGRKLYGLEPLAKPSKRNRARDRTDQSQDRSSRTQERAHTDRSDQTARAGESRWRDPVLLSEEETARMADPASGIAPSPSAERLAEITARAHFLYNKDAVKVCAICDHQDFETAPLPWQGTRHHTLLVSALPEWAQYHLVATEALDLHPDLRQLYNVSASVPPELRQYVSELLLSPRGMGKDGHVTVCTHCHSSLVSGNKPKWSIANGYMLGLTVLLFRVCRLGCVLCVDRRPVTTTIHCSIPCSWFMGELPDDLKVRAMEQVSTYHRQSLTHTYTHTHTHTHTHSHPSPHT